jgi:hypothetical protein
LTDPKPCPFGGFFHAPRESTLAQFDSRLPYFSPRADLKYAWAGTMSPSQHRSKIQVMGEYDMVVFRRLIYDFAVKFPWVADFRPMHGRTTIF